MTACTHDINGRRIHKQEGTDATKVFTSKRQLQVSRTSSQDNGKAGSNQLPHTYATLHKLYARTSKQVSSLQMELQQQKKQLVAKDSTIATQSTHLTACREQIAALVAKLDASSAACRQQQQQSVPEAGVASRVSTAGSAASCLVVLTPEVSTHGQAPLLKHESTVESTVPMLPLLLQEMPSSPRGSSSSSSEGSSSRNSSGGCSECDGLGAWGSEAASDLTDPLLLGSDEVYHTGSALFGHTTYTMFSSGDSSLRTSLVSLDINGDNNNDDDGATHGSSGGDDNNTNARQRVVALPGGDDSKDSGTTNSGAAAAAAGGPPRGHPLLLIPLDFEDLQEFVYNPKGFAASGHSRVPAAAGAGATAAIVSSTSGTSSGTQQQVSGGQGYVKRIRKRWEKPEPAAAAADLAVAAAADTSLSLSNTTTTSSKTTTHLTQPVVNAAAAAAIDADIRTPSFFACQADTGGNNSNISYGSIRGNGSSSSNLSSRSAAASAGRIGGSPSGGRRSSVASATPFASPSSAAASGQSTSNSRKLSLPAARRTTAGTSGTSIAAASTAAGESAKPKERNFLRAGSGKKRYDSSSVSATTATTGGSSRRSPATNGFAASKIPCVSRASGAPASVPAAATPGSSSKAKQPFARTTTAAPVKPSAAVAAASRSRAAGNAAVDAATASTTNSSSRQRVMHKYQQLQQSMQKALSDVDTIVSSTVAGSSTRRGVAAALGEAAAVFETCSNVTTTPIVAQGSVNTNTTSRNNSSTAYPSWKQELLAFELRHGCPTPGSSVAGLSAAEAECVARRMLHRYAKQVARRVCTQLQLQQDEEGQAEVNSNSSRSGVGVARLAVLRGRVLAQLQSEGGFHSIVAETAVKAVWDKEAAAAAAVSRVDAALQAHHAAGSSPLSACSHGSAELLALRERRQMARGLGVNSNKQQY